MIQEKTLYDELRRVAGRFMSRERTGHTLQPTALVHEAWVKLNGQGAELQNRAHFVGLAAQLMRRILIDHARARLAEKRGGEDRVLVTLNDDLDAAAANGGPDVIALDDALKKLAAVSERQARIVELKVFGGLGIEETAEALGVAPATVKRDWILARAWLAREIGDA
jgi:RNA polymerase sigma factor (TIGR02999 family)